MDWEFIERSGPKDDEFPVRSAPINATNVMMSGETPDQAPEALNA